MLCGPWPLAQQQPAHDEHELLALTRHRKLPSYLCLYAQRLCAGPVRLLQDRRRCGQDRAKCEANQPNKFGYHLPRCAQLSARSMPLRLHHTSSQPHRPIHGIQRALGSLLLARCALIAADTLHFLGLRLAVKQARARATAVDPGNNSFVGTQ